MLQDNCIGYIERYFHKEHIYYDIASGRINHNLPEKPILGNIFTLSSFHSDAPLKIYFDPTYRCNLRCRHCITSSAPDANTANELGIVRIKELIKELSSIGILELAITGGEPFIHKDIFEIIELIQRSNMNLIITTNGTLITPEKAKRLSELKLRDIRVSLDGCEAVHDDIRGFGSYKRALDGLKNLSHSNVPVSVRTTLTSKSHIKMDRLFEDIYNAGVAKLKAVVIKEAGNATLKENSDLLGYQPTKDDIRCLLELGQNNRICVELSSEDFELSPMEAKDAKLRSNESHSCGAGLETAYISPIGNVLPCSSIPHVVLGNIKNCSFMEVWEGKTARKYRTQASSCKEKKMCKSNIIRLWGRADVEVENKSEEMNADLSKTIL